MVGRAPDKPVTVNEAQRQLPAGDEIFLDHIGHFVADPQAASFALARAGFAPTPLSVQVGADGAPTGTGNVTAMLRCGYVEVLFKTADTPLGQEFEASLAHHSGLHLAAFSTGDAARAHRRLGDAGFPMRPLVQFQRPVQTEKGLGIAAFTVVRVERGAMPEGRIQMLTHRTEDTVWQKRWLSHPNGATGLLDLVIVSADISEAAARFERFAGKTATATPFGRVIQLDRGCITLVTAKAFGAIFSETAIPGLPLMGAYAIQVSSLAATTALLDAAMLPSRRSGPALIVPFPPELGTGYWVFAEDRSDLPWRA